MGDIYKNNSGHKNIIRTKWVEFIRECLKHDNGLSIITFPAEEMQDLRFFKENGLIDWDENETGTYTITKGKIICFEKSVTIYLKLRTQLVGGTIYRDEIGAYFISNYPSIIRGNDTTLFPVDAVNLDYDGNISKNRVKIEHKVKLIFEFQSVHKKSFSFFITWPSTEKDDDMGYKNLLVKTIEHNLEDPYSQKFKEGFEKTFGRDISKLDYDNLSIIGLTKIILKKASDNHYQLKKHEFYIYGEPGRQKMYSVLFNFEHVGLEIASNVIYAVDVQKALSTINKLE